MDIVSNDILTLGALVAAYVGVVRGFGLADKWTHITALIVAAVFVLVPDVVQQKLILISVIGLSATGAYQFTKKKEDKKDANI
ncbi:hypothetical protein [Paenibacillus apiarius]|uniref:Holin n=1 Tax=Paenibacillus apiarius TaxID=46240 RepID=A0ABT4DQR1_9BACL|nr:hypothetical protein [Paenibacillus apiarius]MCY9513326.1 hypothetical protein [Paenibacillus apiarius]MCY9519702.1 hypothetical protein [Paenibacillus apiarius]MCY9553242.1 hypothetical protein [Paenibacillus apiarius]MCY9557092.1 hypothetical protein [Paenibacillus apiarius]MCY9682167.1 hypothetical protein [Paenibacillus apiarius]